MVNRVLHKLLDVFARGKSAEKKAAMSLPASVLRNESQPGAGLSSLLGLKSSQPLVPAVAWDEALHAWGGLASCLQRSQLAAPFQSFGAAHDQLALTLWDQRHDLASKARGRIVHISGPEGLLAIVNLSAHEIQAYSPWIESAVVGRMNYRTQILPASAHMLDAASAKNFERIDLMELMWYLGQTQVETAMKLPPLGAQKLSIRRMPPVRPAALQMRQLSLIHLLSQNQLNFEQLSYKVERIDQPWLCADLSSLALTRILEISAPAA